MKFLLLALITVQFYSCATPEEYSQKKASRLNKFKYEDQSGTFLLKRANKFNKNKIITRSQILDMFKKIDSPLETSVVVSKLGTINGRPTLQPSVSQFSIWFEKQKYFSQMKVNAKTKSLDIILKSPDKKWNGTKTIKFPSEKIFCYFSQFPECVKANKLLILKKKEKIDLVVIWDSYPYHNEQYEAVGSSPFTRARFYLSDVTKDEIKYTLDLGNQVIFYHFNMKLEFTKMFWIPQGISIKRQEAE